MPVTLANNPVGVSVSGYSIPGWIRELLDRLRQTLEDITRAIRDRIEVAIEKVAERIDRVSGVITTKIEALSGKIVGLADRLIDSITTNVSRIIDRIQDVFDDLSSRFSTLIGNLTGVLRASIDGIIARVRELADRIVAAAAEVAGRIQDVIAFAIGGLVQKIGEIKDAIGEWLRWGVEAIGLWIREMWERIVGGVRTLQERVVEALDVALASVIRFVGEHIQRFVQKVNEIWGTVETFARQTLAKVFAFLSMAVGRATDAAEYIVKIVELIWGYIVRGDYAGAFKAVDELFRTIGLPPLLSWVRSFVAAIAYFWMTIQIQFIPMHLKVTADAESALRLRGIDVVTAAQALHLGYISEEEFMDNAARGGIPDGLARAALATVRRFPEPGALGTALLRGIIGDGEYDSAMRALGYSDGEAQMFKRLLWFLPTPTDLIRMAVREVFSPEIVEKFGQMEDFPKEFVAWGKKVGLSEEIAKLYWAAHWDLPSPTMGFEMFHRGIISEEELKMLLRALDVMPYWREKMIGLSYSVPTRVDVRRMYKIGIYDRDRVYRAYLDMGYKPTDAEALTEFTVRYYTPEDFDESDKYREMTQGILIRAYKKGVISRDVALERLLEIKYSPQDANLLLQIADVELAIAGGDEDVIPLRTRTISIICDAYKRGVLSADEVRQYLGMLNVPETEQEWYIRLSDFEVGADDMVALLELAHKKYGERTWDARTTATFLSELGLSGERITSLLQRWEIDRMARFRKPSEAQFRAALQRGIISLETYAEELRGLGFEEHYVEMLVKLAVGGK